MIGDERKLLKYRVEGNVIDLKEWGHLYVKKLIGCIMDVKSSKLDFPFENTEAVSLKCVDFLFRNNAEFEAIDFLLEIDMVEMILKYVDAHNYNRIILYLEDMDSFIDLEDIILRINLKMENHSKYVVRLISHCRMKEAIEYVRSIEDSDYKQQCLYILARCNLICTTSLIIPMRSLFCRTITSRISTEE